VSIRHAISRLKEERRILHDVHRQILADPELNGDPAKRAEMAAQALDELRQVVRAIFVLQTYEAQPNWVKEVA